MQLARLQPLAAVLLVLAGAPLFGCGVDREAFVREANASCREYRAELASASTETWEVWPRALARHIETLRTLEVPEADRARWDELLRHQEDSLEAAKAYVRYAQIPDEAADDALARSNRSAVTAARLARELGLGDCDRALS